MAANFVPPGKQLFKSGWTPSNLERYNRFVTALVHGEDWSLGVKYFAIYWLGFHGLNDLLNSPMFENSENMHAEDGLLRHLRLQLEVMSVQKLKSLTIMQSASPCSACSEKYFRELGELSTRRGVLVTIVFSSLYNIQRPSCIRGNHRHGGYILSQFSDNNKRGLQKLGSVGILFRCTHFQDWINLRAALQLPNTYSLEAYNFSSRKREDDALRQDLIDIFRS